MPRRCYEFNRPGLAAEVKGSVEHGGKLRTNTMEVSAAEAPNQ